MNSFFSGAICCGYVVITILFMKSWMRTKDPLFKFFSVAFGILAFEQVAVTFYDSLVVERFVIHLLRLLAFALIAIAICRKNMGYGK